jgi:transcriptional regulator with XRE-family HTH domain
VTKNGACPALGFPKASPAPRPSAPAPDVESLGERLRSRRLLVGLSQRGLARRIERRHSVVSRWEHDRLEPALPDLVRLARLLRVTVDQVLSGVRLPAGRRWSSRAHPARERAALGAALAALRVHAGLDLRGAVEATGIPGRRIDRIEAGADPSLAELRRLLEATGVTMGELLATIDDQRRSALDMRTVPHKVPASHPRGDHRNGQDAVAGPLPAHPAWQLVTRERQVVLNKVMLSRIVLGPLAA